MEVLSPETIAGVRAVLSDGEAALEYEDQCLNAGTVSGEKLSPMECLPELMAALREGWLLAESREEVGGSPCLRLTLDRTGARAARSSPPSISGRGTASRSTARSPWRGKSLLKAAFTDFTFGENCDTIDGNTD